MAGQPQAGAQPNALAHPAPQPAVGADGAGAAVAQLQAQINDLQVQLFSIAVARQTALANHIHHEYPSSPSVGTTEQKRRQVIRFDSVFNDT